MGDFGKVENCTFVLTDEENSTTVAIKDNSAGGFILVAKGQGKNAAAIVKEAEKQMKLVVETMDAVTIYNSIEEGAVLTQFDGILIDIMKEKICTSDDNSCGYSTKDIKNKNFYIKFLFHSYVAFSIKLLLRTVL